MKFNSGNLDNLYGGTALYFGSGLNYANDLDFSEEK